MIKPLYRLLLTQFLTAMADNMVLMATIFIIHDTIKNGLANVYVGIVQAAFFVAFVLLAPFAGVLSEKIPKSTTLWIGNILKLIGAGFLLMGVDPALSYAIVGIGACIYGPGKYAILRELTSNEKELYRANGMVEGSTIVAILLGTVSGGILSAKSVSLAMTIIIILYALSFFFAWILPKGGVSDVSFRHTWKNFGKDIGSLWKIPAARTSIFGTSNFWMTSSVLRLSVLAWVPIALSMSDDKASLYMGVSAIGIMTGAVLSPKLIPLNRLSRLLFIGGGMGLAVALVGFLPHIILTGVILFIAGFCGGSFMVPLNTTLQEKGASVGSGKIIAIQNFFENLLMLTGTLIYTGLLKINVEIPFILLGFGISFILVSTYVRTSYKKLETQ